MDFDKSLMTALAVYFISCYVLYTLKHPKMFDDQGHFKCFGLGPNDTIFPFWLVTTVIGVSAYYGFVLTKYYE